MNGVFGLLRAGALALVLLASPVRAETLVFAALGDMPYNLPDDDARYEALIAEFNRREPAFTIHVGDTQSSRSPCSDALREKAARQFSLFTHPVIYTPGDNEWTDCHLHAPPDNDPQERLAKIRQQFFAEPSSLGQRRIPLVRQNAAFPENARWEAGGIVFATVHVVGSNNNLQRDAATLAEYSARNQANLVWIEAAFARAREAGAGAVVLGMQADLFFEKHPYERTGFNDTIAAITEHAKTWTKPILLIQGDTHRYKVDQPLYEWSTRARFPHVTRLIVPGAETVHGVVIEANFVDASAPFAFRLVAPKGN